MNLKDAVGRLHFPSKLPYAVGGLITVLLLGHIITTRFIRYDGAPDRNNSAAKHLFVGMLQSESDALEDDADTEADKFDYSQYADLNMYEALAAIRKWKRRAMHAEARLEDSNGLDEADVDTEYARLDKLAKRAGSDKSSDRHNYMRAYAEYLPKYTTRRIKLLEIGIFEGASVRIWEEYFSNATLHFLDLNDHRLSYKSTRSHFHFFSQADKEKLTQLAESEGPFDIIIDDGSHMVQHVITSFKVLFPYMRPHGLYIVEDLHSSYWRVYGGKGSVDQPRAGPGTSIDFLKNLVDEVNFVGSSTGRAGSSLEGDIKRIEDRGSYYTKHIDSVRFYSTLLIRRVTWAFEDAQSVMVKCFAQTIEERPVGSRLLSRQGTMSNDEI